MGNGYYSTLVKNNTDEAVVVVFYDNKRNPTKFVLNSNESKTIPTDDGSNVTLSAHRVNGGKPDEAQITLYQSMSAKKSASIIKKNGIIEFIQD